MRCSALLLLLGIGLPLAASGSLADEPKIEMVVVPAGEFLMGSDGLELDRFKSECRRAGQSEETCRSWGEREVPRHRVYLTDFYIDRHEVTNAMFEIFSRAAGYRTTAERESFGRTYQDGQWRPLRGADWRNPGGPGTLAPADHPVVQVSWRDADAYCRWARKRLPTEAEWEKAARGTDGRRFPWGNDWDPSKANSGLGKRSTAPVGSFPGGSSPYGVSDMAGNVAEWVADWFDDAYYKRSPEWNPPGPSEGTSKVVRGGSWTNYPVNLRTTDRGGLAPDARNFSVGFRCAKIAIPPWK